MQLLKTRNILLFLLCLGMMSLGFACHPKPDSGKYSQVSKENGTEEYPLLEHLEEQKICLLVNSGKVGKEIEPDGKYLTRKFASGRITLVLDEIDGEPAHFYGRIPGAMEEDQLEFLIYKYSNEELDRLVPGEQYQVDWLETIAYMEPFNDGYYHCFVAYQIVEVK